MPGVTIPDGGVILGTAPTTVGQKNLNIHSQQAMRVTFADNSILEDVLKHGADLKISFGKSMRFVYGSQTMEIVSIVEPNRHELYRASINSPEELAFAATFTHQLEARELEDEVKDESLLALQESYRRINQEKEASTTFSKGGKLAAYPKKTTQVSRAKPQHSLANTPLSRGARSPENSAHINAKLEALRIPLIHLLAIGPDSEQNLASKTRVSNEICVRILQKVGNRVGKQWQLVDDIYKDLDLWDFPYPSSGDRDQAIANCREAFNRLRLSREATEWQMILAPEDRGKVDPNPPPPQPVKPSSKSVAATPSITVTAENPESKSSSQTSSSKKASGESMARTASSAKAGKPAPKDAISRIIGKKGKKPTAVKSTPKPKGPIGRPPKSTTTKTNKANMAKEAVVKPKVKSAERVEDSDEDIEMEDAKQPPSVAGSGTSDHDVENSRFKPKKAATQNIKSPIKKQRRDISGSTGSSSTTAKRKNASVKASSNVSKTPMSRDYIPRRSSSNSPPKPSPLGSSPPINASDIDNTSVASSPFLASIGGTSTPGRSPLEPVMIPSRSNKSKFLPISSPSLKRKAPALAERDDRGPPSRAGSSKPPTSSTAAEISSYSSKKRRNTSSPDEFTLKMAQRFKEDHARYERLYNEVSLITDSIKRKEKLDIVLNMHRELATLKAQITASTSVH
ncbi:hypothetical protein P167DRAFT_555494 [Morchella conica CCBAS932]|uniref:Uncharacterized protein n=1 Tax=Morchella conica CCBAS932 TaxID=1392247 RepID=A0A3N4KCH4_9PEZI|nr:hypothetical protein P167DRAFT_555494 [Morchella conica CCBAS932]